MPNKKAFDFADVGYASALMITLSTIVFAAVLVFSQFRKNVELVKQRLWSFMMGLQVAVLCVVLFAPIAWNDHG